MKRRLSIVAVGAVVAASLGAATPANAATSTHCELLLRSQDIVDVGPGQINIYPANAGPYASHVVAAVRAYVTCIVDEAVGPTVACAKALVANRPTVTIDPNTLQITIDYSEFLGTACTI
ncbi:MAG: hypothetical protein M3323_04200 [Actinomycetota bacterium]|nr:hypothetical protein [Actinomycetota bacterium]